MEISEKNTIDDWFNNDPNIKDIKRILIVGHFYSLPYLQIPKNIHIDFITDRIIPCIKSDCRNKYSCFNVFDYSLDTIIFAIGQQSPEHNIYLKYDYVFELNRDIPNTFLSYFSKNVIDLRSGENISFYSKDDLLHSISIRYNLNGSYCCKYYLQSNRNGVSCIEKFIFASFGSMLYESRPFFSSIPVDNDKIYCETLWQLLYQYAQRHQIHGDLVGKLLFTHQKLTDDDKLIEDDEIYGMITSEYHIWDLESTSFSDYQKSLSCIDSHFNLFAVITKDLHNVYHECCRRKYPVSKNHIEKYIHLMVDDLSSNSPDYFDIIQILPGYANGLTISEM